MAGSVIKLSYLVLFSGREVVVLSNGLTKEDQVPPKEIDLAMHRKAKYETDPVGHTYTEE